MAYSGGRRSQPGETVALPESLLAMDDIVSFVPRSVKVLIVNRKTLQQRPHSTRVETQLVTVSLPLKAGVDRRLSDQASVTRNDCRLDITVAIQHVAEDLLQPR
jgi:hypothetical protein